MNCRTTQILRLENDRIASRLQSMWKEMHEDAQFENSHMQLMWNELQDNANFKIRK